MVVAKEAVKDINFFLRKQRGKRSLYLETLGI